MTNEKDIVNMLESVWTCNNVWECCGDKTEYELIQEAIKEIKHLRLVANAMKTDNAKLRKAIVGLRLEITGVGVEKHRLKVENERLQKDLKSLWAN